MNRHTIAIIFGGHSPEYGVSLESAYAVAGALPKDRYNLVMAGISREGNWFHFAGSLDKLKNDTWLNEKDCVPAMLSPDRSSHELLLLKKNGIERIKIDAAFPILHGKNGEDGTVQGLIELAGIPLVGCGVLSSALCMDKERAHKLAGEAGVRIPKSFSIYREADRKIVENLAARIGYPLFAKPIRAGSSFGVSRVAEKGQLWEAVRAAFQYDNRVIIEENIEGFETGCAVLGNKCLITGEVDEIELSGGFFDFTEKYTLKTSAIHVPARISSKKAEEIKRTAKTVYRALGCAFFARVDMFLTPKGEIVFNEVNTIPGFTAHSRYPSMMKEAGYSFPEIVEKLVSLALEGEG